MKDIAQLDPWAAWLLSRRQGGAELPDDDMRQRLQAVRDRVLAGAYLQPDDVLLDVGCGDGLIGFAALELLPEGRVIFSDVSRDLLDRCEALADGLGVTVRCSFVEAAADRLEPIPDSSVDVVTTRSVLIYVAEKASAFAEFYRVLRPAGRLSVFEPINRFTFPEPPGIVDGFDLRALSETIVAKVNAAFNEGASERAPMMDFDERDLVAIAESAGFGEIHLTYEVEIGPRPPQDWVRYLNSSGNPLSPTLDEALRHALTLPSATALLHACARLSSRARGPCAGRRPSFPHAESAKKTAQLSINGRLGFASSQNGRTIEVDGRALILKLATASRVLRAEWKTLLHQISWTATTTRRSTGLRSTLPKASGCSV